MMTNQANQRSNEAWFARFRALALGVAMTANEILDQLKPLGLASYKKVLLQHGIPEQIFGVKIEELKKIQKKVKVDYQLALDLYDTGVYDAMYLAGLIADDEQMTKKDLKKWVKNAPCAAIAEYTVSWVAAEGRFGRELALEWIDAKADRTASAGWNTLGCLVSITEDEDLDMAELTKLIARVGKTIHDQPNRTRYCMNGFLISVACYVTGLSELAIQTSARIGPVHVDMGDTSCKVPDVAEYVRKVTARGSLGKKRKTVKC